MVLNERVWICLFLKFPDLKDAEAVQKFFLEEIQLGEELLSQGRLLIKSLPSP